MPVPGTHAGCWQLTSHLLAVTGGAKVQGCSPCSPIDKHLSSVARTVNGTRFAAQLQHFPGAPGAPHDVGLLRAAHGRLSRRMAPGYTGLHRPVNITYNHVAATRKNFLIVPRCQKWAQVQPGIACMRLTSHVLALVRTLPWPACHKLCGARHASAGSVRRRWQAWPPGSLAFPSTPS